MKTYVNLRTFTHYSRFESTIFIKKLIKQSIEMGLPAVAICDRMNLFGAVEFFEYCKGIKPILGCLINTEDFGYIPLFIQNQEGYEYISYILSMAAIRDDKVTTFELEKNKGVIALTGGLDGVFYSNPEIEKLRRLKEIFTDRLYVEIQNTSGKNWLLEAAVKENIPIVCTRPVYFLKEEDAESYLILDLIKDKKIYSSDMPLSTNYLLDKSDLDFQEGIENIIQIAKRCSFFLEKHAPIFPKFCNTIEEEIEQLSINSYRGLEKLAIKTDDIEIYKKRLEFELNIIITKGFAGYFLITQDFVNFAKTNQIAVGPGRGSGTGSLVAYCLGITQVDPIEFNLIFERFLNPERNASPDFDIDYDPDRRDEVINYLAKKYGELSVAHIITFGRMQARSVIRDVARTLGFSFSKSDEICKLIPEDQVNPICLEQALNIVPQLKKLITDPNYEKLIQISLKLEGICRNFSKHAAGVVLSNKNLYNYCPLFRVESGDLVTQFNMKDLEYIGLIKFDFLGLRTLAINKLAIKNIYINKGIIINNIPLNDEKTFKLIQSGKVLGIFQLENPALKDIIKQLKPNNIEDIIALIALWRPGPVKKIPDYVRRKNKLEPVIYPHELTETTLKTTYGIMVYQEQVMDIARICGKYTLAEADNLRRAMGKKQHDQMEKERDRFVNGCIENNISKDIAIDLFNQMSEFSGYGFNKGHAAPYGIISYTSAYLKANYPEEFFAAFLSLENDPESIINFIYDIKSFGINILPPCVLNSLYDVIITYESIPNTPTKSLQNHEQKIKCIDADQNKSYNQKDFKEELSLKNQDRNQDNNQDQISEDFIKEVRKVANLRFPVRFVKNIGEKLTQNIMKYNYHTIFEFFNKNREFLNIRSFRNLIFSGALDCFGYNRKVLLDNMKRIMMNEHIEDTKEEWSILEKAQKEYEGLNIFFHDPLEDLREILTDLGLKDCESTIKNRNIIAHIIKITRKRRGKGINYALIQIGDEKGLLDLTAFSQCIEIGPEIKVGKTMFFSIKDDKIIKIQTLEDFFKTTNPIVIYTERQESFEEIIRMLQAMPDGHLSVSIAFGDNIIKIEKTIQDSLEFRLNLKHIKDQELL